MSQSTTAAMLYLALILCFTAITLAQTAAPRENTCCGFLLGKMYCHGGSVFTSDTENRINYVMTVLDLTNKSGMASEDLQKEWLSFSYDGNNADLTARADPQCIVLGDQNRMIVNGGYNNGRVVLKDINIMYNALENKWYSQPAYAEAPYGTRQIFAASGSYVPGKGAAFFGGYEDHFNPNWTTPYANDSLYRTSGGSWRTIGYTQVSYFDADSTTSPWNTPVPLTTAIDQFSARHQSVFDPSTNMLLFMGGEYRTMASPDLIYRPYSYIKTFNTLTNEWGTMNLGGVLPTQGRYFSTLTLLPSTGRHVLLYGGETSNNAVVLDYCNVLNLDTKNWTRQIIDAPAGTILQRSRHSSVLVNNNTLFVMWGTNNEKRGTTSVLVLNTTNPDAITMSKQYIDPNAPTAAEDSNDNTVQPGEDINSASTALSTGAKAGIIVAAVVVVILGALLVWFCLHKKKNERIRSQEHELTKQHQQAEYYNTTDVEPMEVDWDQLETKYTEMPATKFASNNERFGAGSDSAASRTMVNNGEPNSTGHAVYPDAVEVQRPNAMDSPPHPSRVMKPDGGY